VPIFVLNQCGNIAYVNSKALEEALISKSAAPPSFQRDPNGELTGVIFEGEAIGKVALIIPPPDPADVKQWVADTFKNCAS
jgi:predicted amidohydrolase YtcJ